MKKILALAITGLFIMLGSTASAFKTKTNCTNEDKPDFVLEVIDHQIIRDRWATISVVYVGISNNGEYFDGDVKILITYPGGSAERNINYKGTGTTKTYCILPTDENGDVILLGTGDHITAIVDPYEEIDESDESNNEKTITVKSKAKPFISNFFEKILTKFDWLYTLFRPLFRI